MAKPITLNICHMYPDLMDTYGDKGNIITLIKRCEWRGIKTNLSQVSVNDSLNANDIDIYFFGGGQDRQQIIVGKDLQKKAKTLKSEVDQGVVMLSVCGGYQLLQNYFKTLGGEEIKGISVFDAHTIGSTTRMIQNLSITLNPQIESQIKKTYPTSNIQYPTSELIGFENHSGKTYLGGKTQSLGQVIIGAGNNGEDQTEGAVYKNAFGCYLHGSLLPKNPHFADYLIVKAIERQYGGTTLKQLDDSIEWRAHKYAVSRARSLS